MAGKDRFRPYAGALRKWPENGPPANLIRIGVLARGLAGGKLRAAPACTLASPPTTSKHYLCKAVPCTSTRQDEAGALSCRLGRSVPELPSVSFASSCWTRRAGAKSTWYWCGAWTGGDDRWPT